LAFVQTTSAAITPGTHPHKVNSATISIVPQPLSNTANGGNRMQSKAPYILAAGDIRSGSSKQISTAVGDGATAGMSAERLLQELS